MSDKPEQDLARWLFAQGIDPAHTSHPPIGPVKIARIYKLENGMFDFCLGPRGELAFIHPIYGHEYFDPYDTVAWCRSAPASLYRHTGVAAWLGEDAVDLAYHSGHRLNVHVTPLAWLRAAGDGAVMLEPESCRFDLMRLETIVAPTLRFGGYLDALVRPKPSVLPRVKVAVR